MDSELNIGIAVAVVIGIIGLFLMMGQSTETKEVSKPVGSLKLEVAGPYTK